MILEAYNGALIKCFFLNYLKLIGTTEILHLARKRSFSKSKKWNKKFLRSDYSCGGNRSLPPSEKAIALDFSRPQNPLEAAKEQLDKT